MLFIIYVRNHALHWVTSIPVQHCRLHSSFLWRASLIVRNLVPIILHRFTYVVNLLQATNCLIDSIIYGWLIFVKGAISFNGEKTSVFSKQCWDNWISTWKKWNWTPTSYMKINLKWITDLHVAAKTIKV